MSKLKMVEKGGKKVPFYAADGKGKMNAGGAVKKSLRPKARPKGLSAAGAVDRGTRAAGREAQDYKSIVQKKASGGVCRGMGAAVKGGKYSKA